ncbi:5'/3'-nucleotidase SurE [Halobacteriales archaeon QS_8_69_26]|nr:MAG: 5'/3'-nucleotidase SurE [Halobacteriales archaeon QS_8_69_26]
MTDDDGTGPGDRNGADPRPGGGDDEEPTILLTNDDGIGSPGFRATFEALTSVGEVTAVAPARDQSAVGRAITIGGSVTVEEHALGYALAGTPADCVVAGLEALVPDADLVVSGCNKGANLGAYVLGRSGTVSAAVEAAFFDVPAIAVSLYVEAGDEEFHELETEPEDYAGAARAAAYLAEHAPDAGVFDRADYLNVNAPVPDGNPLKMEITEPSLVYDMEAVHRDREVHLRDRIWERMATGDVPDPDGTDRRAVVDGNVSVSPLTAPHTTERHDALDALAETF